MQCSSNIGISNSVSCQEEAYILSILSTIKNILVKDIKQEVPKFIIPMVREGILDTINEMHAFVAEDNSTLPSMDYIKFQLNTYDLYRQLDRAPDQINVSVGS